jgi:dTDP-4-dehydrorhamnose reductase
VLGELLVFGAGSLVGSDFAVAAAKQFVVRSAGRTDPRSLGLPVRSFQPLDLSDEAAVRGFVSARSGDAAWINFAARTDVDGCEAERPTGAVVPRGGDRAGSAWRLNAAFPGWLAEEAHRQSVQLLHISTDFVFDGADGPYPEEALPSPWSPSVSWYGYTKGEGERRVREAGGRTALLRISYPYRTAFPSKPDFARNLLDRGRTRRLYPLYTDQVLTPTWIPDVSRSLLALIAARSDGTFHVASPQPTTPFEFATELFQAFEIDVGRLAPALLGTQAPTDGRAPRPLRGGLRVRRIREVGVHPTGFREGIRGMATAHDDSAPPA